MSTITFITGANQGIGRAAAERLAKEYGHHVIIGARDPAAGSAVAESLKAEGCSASSVQLDLRSQESIEAAVSALAKEHGHIDVLVNNAAILLDTKGLNLSTRDLFDETFQTNVIGTACLMEAVSPLLRNSTAPRVVFVSSIMGSLTLATNRDTIFYAMDYKAYDCSKAAVNMLALNYARQLSDVGARVNVACPGLVSTNLNGYMKAGSEPFDGAQRIVELATVDKDGPTETFSNASGPLPW